MSGIDSSLKLAPLQVEKPWQNGPLQKDAEAPLDEREIKRLSEEFESIFLGIVLKSMRDTVQKSGLVDGGNAEEIYRSMLDTEYAKIMASQRNTGLADNIEKFLLEAHKGTSNAGLDLAKAQGLNAYKAQDLQKLEKQARMLDGMTKPNLREVK